MSKITNENNELTLGRGELMVSANPFQNVGAADIDLSGFVPLGNCSDVKVSISTDYLTHDDMRSKISHQDRKIAEKRTGTLTMTCDNMQEALYNAFLFGSVKDNLLCHTPATGKTEIIKEPVPWAYYVPGQTQDCITGVGIISKPVITLTEQPSETTVIGHADTPFVDGVDYHSETNLGGDHIGRIQILPNGRIAAAPKKSITMAFDILQSTQSVIVSGEEQQTWQMYFRADNPEGRNRNFYCPKVVMSPSGDLSFVGREWMAISLTGDLLKPSNSNVGIITIFDNAEKVTS